MKKHLILATLTLFMAFSVMACGEQEEQAEVSANVEKDFDGESYSDTGSGTFSITNESGSTKNGDNVVVYAGYDDLLIQIGAETTEINGGALSYIYIDGVLSSKEQLGDAVFSIDLSGANLNVGEHKVELVQFANDDESGQVTTYKSCSYEVKGK